MMEDYVYTENEHKDSSLRRPRPPRTKGLNSGDGLKLLFDVIQNLNQEQRAIVKSIGFASILDLSCSGFPIDVFNWLARYINSSTGSIDLPNGFSFTVRRESVHLVMGLPIGFQAISFCSSPDIVQQVNMEIHGKDCTPSIYELANLIRNGLLGSPFTKAFMLLVNCLFICPTSKCLPSSSYYNAISDERRIKDFDWCSYALHWLLLCVNKYQLNDHCGNCEGCGLIPVVIYFEFLVASQVRLGTSIPRLSVWTDNVLNLYAILDANPDSTFGRLPMKHLCCTPFAQANQKRKVTYDLPMDVVNFIERNYNPQEQKNVTKKLKVLSTNLHESILSSASRAISNCVDEVLRAFCKEGSTVSVGEALYFMHDDLHCNDLLDHGNVGEAALTSTKGTIKDMIYYYMDSSFPPFPEFQIEDEVFSASEIFTALVQQLSKEHELPDIEPDEVDDYLSRTLVTKLEIQKNNADEEYEPMSLLDACKLNMTSPCIVQEEKIDFSSWFPFSERCISQDGRNNIIFDPTSVNIVDDPVHCPSERKNIECQRVHLYKGSTHGLSLNEHLLGHPSSTVTENNDNEYPSYSLGEEFEENFFPNTPKCRNVDADSTMNVSFEGNVGQQTEKCPSSTAEMLNFPKSLIYQSSINPEAPSNNAQLNEDLADGNHGSLMNEWQDVQLLDRNQRTASYSNAFGGLERRSSETRAAQFNMGSSHGLSCEERTFRPFSLKHVQSHNTLTPPNMLSDDSKMNSSAPPTKNYTTNRPSTFMRNSLAAQHLTFENTMCDRTESCPSSSQKKQLKVSFLPDMFQNPTHIQNSANVSRMNSNQNLVKCTPAEDELFTMLTSNANDIVFSMRIFQIEERWTDERTLARCMSNGGYINEYVMDAFIKMFLFNQKMKDMHGEKIGFVKHITFSEISEALMYPSLDLNLYKKLFTEAAVGFRLEHAGLVHIPCSITKQWFLVANFMDKCFDVLNPSHNSDVILPTVNAVVRNFKELFTVAYPHCPNFKIADFKVRNVNVPKQNFKYDSGFFVLIFMQFYNGLEVPSFSNEDLPALKRKSLYQLVTNKYNIARQSKRIKDFISKHVSPYW